MRHTVAGRESTRRLADEGRDWNSLRPPVGDKFVPPEEPPSPRRLVQIHHIFCAAFVVDSIESGRADFVEAYRGVRRAALKSVGNYQSSAEAEAERFATECATHRRRLAHSCSLISTRQDLTISPTRALGERRWTGRIYIHFFSPPFKWLAGSLVGGFGASIARSRVELSYATLVSPLFSAGH